MDNMLIGVFVLVVFIIVVLVKTAVVVEQRDRWGWMNAELVEAVLSAHGRGLVVLDDGEVDEDLVGDLV